jgi:uncharacterized protein YjgD (DUF1641 family)
VAKPIQQIEKKRLNEAEEEAEALKELVGMIADSKESIKTFLEILEELDRSGLLDMAKGLLKTRQKVGVLAMEQMNQPAMHRIIKNGINTVQFLGQLDPDQMKTIMNGVSKGLEKTSEGSSQKEQVGLWSLIRTMRDPDIRASMTMMTSFLEGMGKEISQKPVH